MPFSESSPLTHSQSQKATSSTRLSLAILKLDNLIIRANQVANQIDLPLTLPHSSGNLLTDSPFPVILRQEKPELLKGQDVQYGRETENENVS